MMTSSEKNSVGPTSLAASRMTATWPRGGSPRGDALVLALEMLVRVLDHDDAGVDHHADGEREAAEAHDVGVDAEQLHHQDRRPAGRSAGRTTATSALRTCARKTRQMSADDDQLLDHRLAQRVDGALDQRRAVVGRRDEHARRQAVLELGELGLGVAGSPGRRSRRSAR